MRTLIPAALSFLLASPVAAQSTGRARVAPAATPRPVGAYAGVEPGAAQPPPAYRRVVRRRGRRGVGVILTWPGFSPLGNGGSRFFVQTADPANPEVRVEQGRIVVTFPRTTTHLGNSRRWLETRFFNTPVTRARLERRRRDMALVLHIRPASQNIAPTVTTEAAPGGAFYYVYIDFPPGEYAAPPSEAQEGAYVGSADGPPPAPAREQDPTLEAEAPPAP